MRRLLLVLSRVALSSLMVLVPASAGAQDAPDKAHRDPAQAARRMTSGTFAGLALRGIGPALMSGRISDVDIDRVDPNIWYVCAGSGNVWKTVNAGTTWEPIFERYGSYSIGCLTIDPQRHLTIWVGTGEDVSGRHVGYGDGIYRSLDGGRSFTNMGLRKTEHIARIVVHPRNSDIIYVAAQGPLWAPGGERGVYRSVDGGKTWKCILSKGPYTGATDIVLDPRNPDVLFAALHQRHRSVAALIDGGPESGIYKSTDGGDSWRELKRGLPSGDKGKIGLAISPQRPDVMYATIELAGRTGGFWRSADGGETWTRMSDYISGGTGPHYYMELWADPHRFDVVYQADVRLARTEDGGKTWKSVDGSSKHVDNHAIAFHPTNPDFVLVGCDGGLYRSYDYCRTYQYCANLPLTQYYKLSLDNDFPFYHIVGGTQDNSTQYGPSRTASTNGILNSDWRVIIGGDGHDNAIDPEDPNIIYGESQQGFLRRYDRRTGTTTDIRPQPAEGEDALRFNWDAPILISPHSHTRLYFGSHRLHRSDDRGNSWTAISPDLSRGGDRFVKKLMGRIWSIDALWDLYAMSQYGTITSIAESPRREGLIYVGTDDGLIQVTEDGGKTWRRIDKIYGIPQFAFVNDIKADLHDADTVYALFDHHKTGDFSPYLMKSTDRGKTWTSIRGDLPDRHIVWRIVQDHVNPKLLFVGTEFGLFFTVDGGVHWIKLTGGVPVIPFRDLEIQRRENDLVGATFGRGFYILDDYAPLRTVTEKQLREEEFILFPVRRALRYARTATLGMGNRRGSQGDAFFTAPNPPYGAVFTYYLRDSLKTRREMRREREAEVRRTGGDNPRPSFDELKQEEREEPPVIVITIRDSRGRIVRRLTGPASAGFHRVAWELDHAPLGSQARGRGPLLPAGTYRVEFSKRIRGTTTPLGKPQNFEVVDVIETTMPRPDPQQVLAFQLEAAELVGKVQSALDRLEEARKQLEAMQQVLRRSHRGRPEWIDAARKLELALLDLKVELAGDSTRRSRSQLTRLSIADRAGNAYQGARNVYGPTATHRRDLTIARKRFARAARELKQRIDSELPALQRKLDRAGIPWSPGRPVPLP